MAMTAHANSVTERATLPAKALAVFVNGLRDLGYQVEAIMAAAGLAPDVFDDPDGEVPCDTYGAVLSLAERERHTPNLALALAQRTPIGAWPLLDYLVVTSDTVGAGVRQLPRYFRLVGNPVTITIHEAAESVRVELSASIPFAIEYDTALLAIHLRSETGGRFIPSAFAFTHAVEDVAGYARVLGCPKSADMSWSGLLIAREAWDLPLRRRDPILRQVLEGHADEILTRLPERTGLAADIQRVLMARLASGDTRIESLGRHFAMSPRTLQRRLGLEGTSYQKLLDAARQASADRYLAESTLSIGEIAYMLGYSEPAPFHRAFRRWHAMTPEAYRAGFAQRGRRFPTSQLPTPN
jgi:AraC-like DNA-binding protein